VVNEGVYWSRISGEFSLERDWAAREAELDGYEGPEDNWTGTTGGL
jgi:hypothetical protein